MRFETIAVTDTGPVRRIAINRPDAHNALNRTVRAELLVAVSAASDSRQVRSIIVAGTGSRAFAAGADIKEMVDCSPVEAEQVSRDAGRLHAAIRACGKPVMASIHGFCLGGGFELALACDLRLCSEEAQFGLPEIKLGIMPGAGGTVQLTRLVGVGWASRLCLTGELIGAAQALSLGIVTEVAPAAQLDAAADRLAIALARLSRSALSQLKATLGAVGECDRATADALESQAFALCFASPDQREGMRAFIEKRKPNFA